jgi:hypothetical protein
MPIDPATFTELTKIYEREIDSIIENFGKDCLLVFHEIITNPNTEISDPLRDDSRRPSYQSDNPQPTSERTTRTLKVLTKHNPSDYENFGVKVKQPNDILKIKSYVTDMPDLKRADYIIPDINVQGFSGARYRLIREPIPRGLKNNRYAVSYWEPV